MALIKSDDNEIVYCRPLSLRWSCAAFAALFIAIFGYLATALVPSKQYMYARSPLEIVGRDAFGMIVLGGLLPILIGLYAAGPDDLILDLQKRTYRFRRGFPWQTKWWEGSFDDIACLYTKEARANSTTHYQMLLRWKGTGGDERFALGDGELQHRKDVFLGVAPSMEEAFQQIGPIAARLGVPAEDGLQSERENREKRASYRLVGYAISIAFGGVALLNLMMGAPDLLVERQLHLHGETTPGTITAKRYGSHSTHVDFRYTVKNVSYISSNNIPGNSDSEVNVGDSVTVTYLPDYPRTVSIPQSNAGRSARGSLGTAGITLLLALGSFIYYRNKSNSSS